MTQQAQSDVRAVGGLRPGGIAERVLTGCGLGWRVEPYDVYDEHHGLVRGYKQFRRSDTGLVLEVRHEAEPTLQNEELLRFFEPFLDSGIFQYHRAREVNPGIVLYQWLYVHHDDWVREMLAVSEIQPFLSFLHYHVSGGPRLRMLVTPFWRGRNTILGIPAQASVERLGKTRSYPPAIRPASLAKLKANPDSAAAQLYKQLERRWSGFARCVFAMKSRGLTDKEYEEHVLNLLAPWPSPRVGLRSRRGALLRIRAESRRHSLRALWEDHGQAARSAGSAWAAYLGAATAVFEFGDLFPTRWNRRDAVMPGGALSRKLQPVLNGLCALSFEK